MVQQYLAFACCHGIAKLSMMNSFPILSPCSWNWICNSSELYVTAFVAKLATGVCSNMRLDSFVFSTSRNKHSVKLKARYHPDILQLFFRSLFNYICVVEYTLHAQLLTKYISLTTIFMHIFQLKAIKIGIGFNDCKYCDQHSLQRSA